MVRPLNEDIKVFGIFGFPLSHTLSPLMHNQALRALQIPGIYFAFERNRNQFLRLLRPRKKWILDGFNLTIPHKETILPYLDATDASAKLVGAVNTVKRVGNRWIGYNTDVYGFSKSLSEASFKAKGKKAVILGAGGGARAVLAALLKLGAKEIVIFNRTSSKSGRLVNEFQKKFRRSRIKNIQHRNDLRVEFQNTDLLVNATSVGLKPGNTPPIPVSFLPRKKRMLVHDLIYGRRKTKLLQAAKRLGHRTADGEAMLLYQGARAFEIWTGKKAPLKTMRKALHDGILAR